MWWGTCLWFSLYAFGFFRESQSFPCRGWEFYRFDSHTVFFPFLLLEEFSAMLLGQQFPSGELYTDENWALPAPLPTLGPGRHDAKCDTRESIALAALTPGSECTHSHPHTLSRPASCWCVTLKSCLGLKGPDRGLPSYPTSVSFSRPASVNSRTRQLVKQSFTFRQTACVHLSGSRGLPVSLILHSVGVFEAWQTDNTMAVL